MCSHRNVVARGDLRTINPQNTGPFINVKIVCDEGDGKLSMREIAEKVEKGK